jgi:excisionase family DNA binding protein
VTALLTHDQAAARIGVCAKTLRQLRKKGLIRYVAVTGRLIKYRPEDIEAFIESRGRVDVPTTRPRHAVRPVGIRRSGNIVPFSVRQGIRG